MGSSPHNSALSCSAVIPVGGPFTHSYFEFRRTKELEQRRVACGFFTVTRHLGLGFLFLEP